MRAASSWLGRSEKRRNHAWALSLTLGALLSSCSAYDPALLHRADGSFDGATGDGSMMVDANTDNDATTDNDAAAGSDAMADANSNGCVPSEVEFCPLSCPETCNGMDDDCDGATDESGSSPLCSPDNATALCIAGACLITACDIGFANCDQMPENGCEGSLDTAEHCGLCFNSCNYANASALCQDGQCAFGECLTGFGNCDGDDSNGCELTVDSLGNCGGCGVVCDPVTNGQPGCINLTCGIAECDTGFQDCDGDVSNGCETSLDALTSCGSCTTMCSFAHADPLCAAQSCVPGTCLTGYSDCDGDPANECEVSLDTDANNCGACGRQCDAMGTGNFVCVDGACEVSDCPAGLADCDNDASNGCETSTRTLTDCAACGVACAFDGGTASCTTGTCTFGSCNPGLGNCNGMLSDGCETPLDTNADCGSCDAECGATDSRTCSGGICSLVSCMTGSADCDNDGLTCEQSLNTTAHCGACNARCGDAMGRFNNASASCGAGTCAIGSCDANYANCDGTIANGCETSLRTTASCGGCNVACTRPNAAVSCATGSCAITACNSGFADCDGNQANGCEQATNTNTHCGGCNTACARPNAVTSCSSGSCANIACNSGFGDCDGNPVNGCETPLNSLTHCGACNTACALANGAETCATGTCTLGNCDNGFGNCDFIAFNGCEAPLNSTQNCNACGALCDYANGTEICNSGTCTLTGCGSGFGNCDTNEANGCEQPLNNNTHCGGCNLSCSRANATATCGTGTCTLGACNSGFGNCDGNAANGCETLLNTNANCGACGAACGVVDQRTCSGGICSLSSCAAGTADCDNDGATCEQSLYTLTNCGGCGVACGLANATATCPSGTCTLAGCNSGFGNCDGDATNGCEQAITTNTHCGGCNVACSRANANASCSTGTCTLGACNAGFANCDGNAANGCETPLNTLTDCGACNTACALANAGESCATGTCTLGTCDSGFGNCDGSAANGCEAPLTTLGNCAACSTACDFVGATESCATGTCTFGMCSSGFGNCDTNLANGCEAALTSLTNCGGCNVACSRANATASCPSGTCTLGACNGGFGNCDANATNGCETALTSLTHCGGCGVACSRANAGASCPSGTCTLGTCNSGFGNCDANAANGCETALTSLTHCGGCNVVCSRTNASASCPGGTCTLDACNSGFGNCDANATNGCETPLTSLTHCAGCNVACARANATASCSTGSCTLGACDPGYGNCDNNPANGCERALNTDTNCGACGMVCNTGGGLSCVNGSCVLTSCTTGTADCDNDMLTCEQSLYTLAHCGACNTPCSRANAAASCPTGSCTLGSCNANFGNCDGIAANGCEQSTLTTAHCGACGVSCSRPNATASCSTGTCLLGTCNAGYGNCDGNAANGCETQLNTLTHCGACNTACDLANAGESCATGSCTLGTCNGGFGDCDLVASNGCEVALTSTSNCNACGSTCDFPGATETCASGTCTFGMCSSGFGSCDGNQSNGCEQALTNNTHCGACNAPCTRSNATASCGTGTCTLGTCNSGFANCDANAANGCETPLGTSANCGACGNTCAVDETCTNSVCQGSFTYTPSNFNPVGIVRTAVVTLACGVTVFNSQTLAFTNWCSGQPQPSVTTRTQSGGPDVVILGFSSLLINSAGTLKLEGDKPVILAVYGDATIAGTINASATGATSGPSGVACSGTVGGNDQDGDDGASGGGGGGFGTAGGNSGSGHNGAGAVTGGAVVGNATLVPLRGGCAGGRGGRGHPSQDIGREGGGAGGAVQISVAGTLTITGTIAAAGGGGLKGGSHEDGGGGGGSGGAVLIEGSAVTVSSTAWLTANGGGGAAGAESDDANVATNGANGTLNNGNRAAGGTGDAGGNGGLGAASAGAATNGVGGASEGCGFLCTRNGAGGGGGGGGTGRIQVRGALACAISASQSPTAGRAAACTGAIPEANCVARAFNNHGYYFCPNLVSWAAASAFCQVAASASQTVAEGATASVTCPGGGTILSYTSRYGTQGVGTCAVNCGSCTIGATSCSVTYNNANCGDCSNGTAKPGTLTLSCSGTGGPRLVRIDDVAENNFVLANAATGESSLGANDITTESTWVWQNNNDVFWIGVGNGAPVGGRYSNWNGGEPNEFDHAGTGEDCGYFTAPGGGWNDNLCTDPKPYICETQ